MKTFNSNTIYNIINNTNNSAEVEEAILEIKKQYSEQCRNTIHSIESLENETNYFNMSDCEINSYDYDINSDIEEIDNTIYEAQESIDFAQGAIDDLETLISFYRDFINEQENNIEEMEDTKSEIEEQQELLDKCGDYSPEHINESLANSAMALIVNTITDEYGLDFLCEFPIALRITNPTCINDYGKFLKVINTENDLTMSSIEFNNPESSEHITFNEYGKITLGDVITTKIGFNTGDEFEYARCHGIFKMTCERIAENIVKHIYTNYVK
jgi:hypothetical protein